MLKKRLPIAAVVVLASGCIEPHPAYELEFGTVDVRVAMNESAPGDPADFVVEARVIPGPEHESSQFRLGRTSRFPDGVLRLYEPARSPFVYDERKPVLSVPAFVTFGGRRTTFVPVGSEVVEFELRGRVSNLELDALCSQPVVVVPRMVVSDSTETEGAAEVRDVRFTATTEVECP